ncbi:hypothetical protein [Actinoplanes sp. NPDC049118]|uniref:hypothetical protein n=1 Tax=Actinoplanes sp. NPDC049118 TaxID=3155769 RepID=UPI0033CDCEA8
MKPKKVRTLKGLLGSALALILALPLTLTTSPAQATGGGRGGLARNQCAVLMIWANRIQSPVLASPYSGYWALTSNKSVPNVDDVAFVISQDFPFTAYGGLFLYPEQSVLPRGLTYGQITPDAGSVNPFTVGTPIHAKKRHYTALLTADSVTTMAPRFASIANRISWQAGNNEWFLLARNYNAYAGYDMSGTGGPTKTAWPDVRAYNVHTGQPIACGDVQLARDEIQEASPWNVAGLTGSNLIPNPIRPMFPQINGGRQYWAPKENPELVEFYRVPSDGTRAPNNAVPNPTDNCANYVQARINPRRIALVRVPQVAQYKSHTPAPDAVFQETEVGALSYSMYGQLTSIFRKGSPFSYSIGNEDIKTDAAGGATIVVWPRSLSPVERRVVFALANARGWNLIEGNQAGPQYANMLLARVNGPAPTYKGGLYPSPYRTGAPCFQGPQSTLDPFGLTAMPDSAFIDIPHGFAVTPNMLGTSTPQGVQCTVVGYLAGTCLARLKAHMTSTGGSYFAS